MPDTNVNVLGAAGYKPTAVQKARIQSFLKTVSAKKLPEDVVIVPEDQFAKVSKTMVGHGDTNWAFSLPETHRVYINAAAFNQVHPNPHYNGPNFPEFLLGHELAHINNSMPLDQQEDQEIAETREGEPNEFDQQSQKYLKQWYTNNGDAYSKAQQNAAASQNQFQTTPASIQTQLVSPNNVALSAPYNGKGSVQSILEAPRATYAARVMASKPTQSYAEKVMSQSPNRGR